MCNIGVACKLAVRVESIHGSPRQAVRRTIRGQLDEGGPGNHDRPAVLGGAGHLLVSPVRLSIFLAALVPLIAFPVWAQRDYSPWHFPVQDAAGVGTQIDIRDIALVEDMGPWVRLTVTQVRQYPEHPGRQLHHHRTLAAFLAQMAFVAPDWLSGYAVVCPMLPTYGTALVSRAHVWEDGVVPFVGTVLHLGYERGWFIYQLSREPLIWVQYYTCLAPDHLDAKLRQVPLRRLLSPREP